MDSETKENNFINFIKINSKIFISITVLLIFVILFTIWNLNKISNKKVQVSDNFVKAQVLLANQKSDEAKKILIDLVKTKNSPYSSLSLFLIIENNLISDKQKVIKYFDLVFKNNKFKKEDLNLLKLKKAIFMSDIKKEQEIIELLNPLINSDSVWKVHALKFLGDFYESSNQQIKAQQYYSLISEID